MAGAKKKSKGLFISMEGPDGAGKSTQAGLLKEKFEAFSLDVLLTREPGGTFIGEKIRELLLDPSSSGITVACETLLYGASRSQLASEVIRPALEGGKVVICDRYLDSSLVYQGFAGGGDVESIKQINNWATKGLFPDITIVLDLDVETGRQRTLQKDGNIRGLDRVEQKDLAFHQRVREGFLRLALEEPKRIFVVSGEGDRLDIHLRIWEIIRSFLKAREVKNGV
jgi:dTMP kinase